jgi:Berberine and berberine like
MHGHDAGLVLKTPVDLLRSRPNERDAGQALGAAALPGGYPNLLAGGDPERAVKSYGGNAGRLIRAKRRYDPDNVFRSAIPLPASHPALAAE